jgi:hypothetical protein
MVYSICLLDQSDFESIGRDMPKELESTAQLQMEQRQQSKSGANTKTK